MDRYRTSDRSLIYEYLSVVCLVYAQNTTSVKEEVVSTFVKSRTRKCLEYHEPQHVVFCAAGHILLNSKLAAVRIWTWSS